MNIDYTLTLSPEQRKFALLLKKHPKLKIYWDFKKRELDTRALDKKIGVLSRGEKVMVQFFAGVWLKENRYNFDLFEAVSILDPEQVSLIREWMADPFWP